MQIVIHAIYTAVQPYIGELLAAAIIALAAKLFHYDIAKYREKLQGIIDAIINEIARVETEQKSKDCLKKLSGAEKKMVVVHSLASKFSDPDETWWSKGKHNMLIKAFGSLPAAVEKAFTIWNAAQGFKKMLK